MFAVSKRLLLSWLYFTNTGFRCEFGQQRQKTICLKYGIYNNFDMNQLK